jgi:hypothetical protein
MCQFIHGARDSNKAGVVQIKRDDSDKPVVVKFMNGGPADAGSEALVLGSLLASPGQQPSGTLRLPRKQRLEIAAAASWAALYLCGTSWLGSDWNGKDDLQVFLQKHGQHNHAAALALYPSISHVFRPVSSRSQESMPPPASAAVGFQTCQIPNRALFTLGILLLELCLGKTFEKIHQDAQANDSSCLSLQNVADDAVSLAAPPPSEYNITIGLMDRIIDEVYVREGDLYGDAIRRCLRCEFPGRDVMKDFNWKPFRKHFLDGVVAPMQALFESCI